MVCLGKDYSHSSDANGNITDDGERIFYWDVEQRLFGILNKNTNRGTVFIYDGLGRRVREYDADLTRGTLDLAQKADYAWCGSKICQTRDASGTSIEMPQGLIRQGSPIAYYFHCDHLGSVVDVSQADGGHLARTMYSPYGQKKLLSSDAAYVEYAGMRFHEPSGLYLTYYRAYDPKLGRWLSRDPIGEAGGLNLYGYVGCRPQTNVDPLGLVRPGETSTEAAFESAIARGDVQKLRNLMESLGPEQQALARQAIEKYEMKAADWISKTCKGNINRKFPGQYRDKTLEEILEASRAGDRDAKTAWKLLNDNRF